MSLSKNINSSDVKKELQGQNGLIKKIRSVYIPSSNQMSKLSQDIFEERFSLITDIDDSIEKLLEIEFELYKQKEQDFIDNFILYSDIQATMNDFPNVRVIIDEFKNEVLNRDNPTNILDGVIKMIIALADSNRQSRVSRAGSSLENHIQYLLSKHGFIEKKDFSPQHDFGSGCVLDFLLPNETVYNVEPMNCCAVACQTSWNDRFRLSFAQLQSHNVRKRACTAIGSSNLSENLGPQSLTDDKLKEARENNIKVVILNKSIDKRLRESKTVMSYKEWFDELKNLRNLW